MPEALLTSRELNDSELYDLRRRATEARAACIQMAHAGKEGHLNGALSSVDLLMALYFGWLRLDVKRPDDPNRDRLLFSKGHACASLYAVMMERGVIPREWMERYATNDTPLPSHPCRHALPLLEFSSGSLGHGPGVGAGLAYALRLKNSPARVAVVISDGECNEGSTWEAATFAAANNLDNLLVIVDNNGVQSVGRADELMGGASISAKFRSFGWEARDVDGHNIAELHQTLNTFPFAPGKPSVLVARTIAGAGVSFMQDQVLWHYRVPSAEDVDNAMRELGVLTVRGGQA